MSGRHPHRSHGPEDVWPAFGDTMLAFLLVLMLLLVFQVGTNIEIVSGIALNQQIQDDQRKVADVVTVLRTRHGAVAISPPDGNAQEITMGSEALFESGSAELSDRGRTLLSALVQQIIHSELRTLKEITVKGHTDDVAIRNEQFASNWELSTARATQVVRFLTGDGTGQTGIDPRRVTLVAAGYGEFRPIDPHDRQKNRRIEIRLVYTNRPDGSS
jgi:flagellar motor protein MotB